MPVSDGIQQGTIAATPGSRVPLKNTQRPRSRTYMLVAVALVVIVITVSSLARSGVPKSLAAAQHHYLTDVTPVEKADIIFNGGGSTPPDHSATSTRTLVRALGEEFNELKAQKWPKEAAVNIGKLAALTGAEERLLQSFETAPSAKQAVLLVEQSTLLDDIENKNVSILEELKLPRPTDASNPVSPPKLVP